MNIIITHGYTDSNKGDVAIALGTVAAIRHSLAGARISSHSNYSEDHVDFTSHSRWVTGAGIPTVEGALPSPYLDDSGSGFRRNLQAGFRLINEVFSFVVLWFIPGLASLHPPKARALHELRRADLVIVRGGQYLHNEIGRIRGLIFLWRMLLNIAIPIWLNKPTVILGLSIGPLHGRLATWPLRETIRRCQSIFVRETLSADFLRTLGLSRNVFTLPDLGFLTLPSPRPSLSETLPRKPRIAVTLINWPFPNHPEPRQALEHYFETVLETLRECHVRYRLIPIFVTQVTVQHHGQGDGAIVRTMAERLRELGVPAQIVADDLTPGELVFLYGQCDLVLATRLHSIIFAACAGTPAVAISYQGFKTLGIMKDLGLEQFAHDINTLSSHVLLDSVQQLLARRSSLSPGLLHRVADFRSEILSTVGKVVTSIGG